MKIISLALVASMAAFPVVAQDSTGLRFGLTGNIEKGQKNASGNDQFLGAFAGYDMDLGGGVLGAELGYKNADLNTDTGTKLGNTLQLKARYGKQIGQGLFYGTAGIARAKASTGGHNNGYLVGFGYEHTLSNKMFLGAEFNHSQYRKVGASNSKASANTLALRAGFKF